MHNFTDNEGRTWSIELNFGSIKRVKAALDIDLLEPAAGEGVPVLTRLGTDTILLVDTIFVLIQRQAEAQGIADEEWAAGMGGEPILEAQRAFYEELKAFFRSRGRPEVARAAERQQEAIELAIREAQGRIDRMDLDKMIGEQMDALEEDLTQVPASGSSSTGSPESVE